MLAVAVEEVRAMARTRQVLAEQMRLVEEVIRTRLSGDDCEAMAVPGYRPKDWQSDEERAELGIVILGDGFGPHPSTTPRWQSEVDRVVDRAAKFPLYLRTIVGRELLALNPTSRRIIDQHCVGGWSFERISLRTYGLTKLSRQGVWHIHEQTLRRLALAAWDDAGMARWEDI